MRIQQVAGPSGTLSGTKRRQERRHAEARALYRCTASRDTASGHGDHDVNRIDASLPVRTNRVPPPSHFGGRVSPVESRGASTSRRRRTSAAPESLTQCAAMAATGQGRSTGVGPRGPGPCRTVPMRLPPHRLVPSFSVQTEHDDVLTLHREGALAEARRRAHRSRPCLCSLARPSGSRRYPGPTRLERGRHPALRRPLPGVTWSR